MAHTESYVNQDFRGLCFVNLVDFDQAYGHRRDIHGYAGALTEFDRWLADFLPKLSGEDLLIITADHGCDPGYAATTDHTRECVPFLLHSKKIAPENSGTIQGFDYVSKNFRIPDLSGS
jgi:phosphopentomutase